jgi:DNA-binding response OmpR family regulator
VFYKRILILRIALLEDDPAQAELMHAWLADAGHDCYIFKLGKTLIRELGRDSFDLIVLDWMLPDTDGIQILRWIRRQIDWPIPVVFVTGRDAEADVVEALEQGADDYMAKPAKRLEVLARIKAVSRRVIQPDEASRTLELGRYRIDKTARTVYRDGQAVELTHKEYDLVLFLFGSAGRVLSRAHILTSVWGYSSDLNTRTVDTHISRIRNKLVLRAEHGWQLKAVYQHGYRLEQI